jgi:hypothetical protein
MKQLLFAGTAFPALAASEPTAVAPPIVFDFTYTGSLVTFMVPDVLPGSQPRGTRVFG